MKAADKEKLDRERQFRQTPEYKRALEFLFDRINYEHVTRMPYSRRDMNLSRMRHLLKLVGDPHLELKVIHIAGTKGKGSTAAFLNAAFVASGMKCGSYTSPHLHHIEERFCIDGNPCAPQILQQLIDELRSAVEDMDANYDGGGPTYFEIATAIACLLFVKEKVDVAILEVGLGGRLDSTNVSEPMLCAITSISFDHMKQLGNTLALIAGEKAGIIKQGVPVVSGVVNEEAKSVIESKARENRADIRHRNIDFGFRNYRPPNDERPSSVADFYAIKGMELRDVELGLVGEHQAANASVAFALIQLLPKDLQLNEAAIRSGFAAVRSPARFEVVASNPTTIIDAAHNVASAVALVDVLTSTFPSGKRRLIIGATKGKDVEGILRVLLPRFEHVVCTRYQSNPRGFDCDKLFKLAQKISLELGLQQRIESAETPAKAWQHVREVHEPTELVCVTGSFFIASEVRALVLSDD